MKRTKASMGAAGQRSSLVVRAAAAGFAAGMLWVAWRSEVGRVSDISALVELPAGGAGGALERLRRSAAEGGYAIASRSGREVKLRLRARSTSSATGGLRRILGAHEAEIELERAELGRSAELSSAEVERLAAELAELRPLARRAAAEAAGLATPDPSTGLTLRGERAKLASERDDLAARSAAAAEQAASLKQSLSGEPVTIQFHPPSDLTADELKVLARARRGLRDERRRLDEMLRTVTERHPFAVKLSAEIEREAGRIAPLEERAHPEPLTRPNPARERLAAALAAAEAGIAELKAASESVRSRIGAIDAKLPGLEKAEAEWRSLRATETGLEKNLAGAREKHAEIKRRLGAVPASAARLGEVAGPPSVLTPASAAGVGGGLAAGLIVAGAFAVAARIMQKGFSSPVGLRRATGLPVLAAVSESAIPYGAAERPATSGALGAACVLAALVLGWVGAAAAGGAVRGPAPARPAGRLEVPPPEGLRAPEPAETEASGPAAPGPAALEPAAKEEGLLGSEGEDAEAPKR